MSISCSAMRSKIYRFFFLHDISLNGLLPSPLGMHLVRSKLFREIKNQSVHNKLQEDLNSLEKWAADWGMHFNAKKCYILSLRKKSQRFYNLNNHILEQVSSSPFDIVRHRLYKHGIKKVEIDNVPFLNFRLPTKVLMPLT